MLVVSHESNEVTVLLRENRREDNPGLQIHMNRKNFFRRSVTPFFPFFLFYHGACLMDTLAADEYANNGFSAVPTKTCLLRFTLLSSSNLQPLN